MLFLEPIRLFGEGSYRDVPQAIPLLEEVHRRRPEREDVAQMLISDYRETGQTMRAGQLETAYRSDFVQAPRRTE